MLSRQKCGRRLIIRDLPLLASNWRMTETLPEYLVRNQVVAIADIDTRRLTRILREKGAQNGTIFAGAAAIAAQQKLMHSLRHVLSPA